MCDSFHLNVNYFSTLVCFEYPHSFILIFHLALPPPPPIHTPTPRKSVQYSGGKGEEDEEKGGWRIVESEVIEAY